MGSSFYDFWEYKTPSKDIIKVTPSSGGELALYQIEHKGMEIHSGFMSIDNLKKFRDNITEYLEWLQEE